MYKIKLFVYTIEYNREKRWINVYFNNDWFVVGHHSCCNPGTLGVCGVKDDYAIGPKTKYGLRYILTGNNNAGRTWPISNNCSLWLFFSPSWPGIFTLLFIGKHTSPYGAWIPTIIFRAAILMVFIFTPAIAYIAFRKGKRRGQADRKSVV